MKDLENLRAMANRADHLLLMDDVGHPNMPDIPKALVVGRSGGVREDFGPAREPPLVITGDQSRISILSLTLEAGARPQHTFR